jgi:hypothetical protein
LAGRNRRVKLDDLLSETARNLGTLFFIDDVDEECLGCLNSWGMLMTSMTINSIDDSHKLKSVSDRLQELCVKNKFDLNAKKCKAISFSTSKQPMEFTFRTGGHELKRIEIKDFGVILTPR